MTYVPSALLFDQTHDSEANAERVASVVAHELAHQWTGNYVTAYWWSELWLNEGFATYFETRSLITLKPTWDEDAIAVLDTQQPAFAADSLLSSRQLVPLQSDIVTTDDIGALSLSLLFQSINHIILCCDK